MATQQVASVSQRELALPAASLSPAELALKWRGVEDRRNPLIRYVPWWVVGHGLAIAAVNVSLLVLHFTVFRRAA